jgi:polyhydroxybutyrate depolymerase
MRLYILFAFTLFGLLLQAQQNIVSTFLHDGEVREFEVHLPPGFDAAMTWPLVINMHGLGSNRVEQRFYSGFNVVADTGDFLVVYPQGLEVNFGGQVLPHWNANFGTGVDDVGFLSRLIDTLVQNYNVDPDRVYSTGMSNGGFMSYTLACELSEKITAIASVTGSMTALALFGCDPGKPVPVMQIHGTADPVVDFNGPPAIDDVVDFWVQNGGCDPLPMVEMIPDIDMSDGTTTERMIYEGCEEGAEVWYYVVDNGGHTWPGSFPIPASGNTSKDFLATTHIWDFFKRFPRMTTSSPNVDITGIKVWPNPAGDILFAEGIEDGPVRIISTLGVVFEGHIQSSKLTLQDLPKGMYRLQRGKRLVSFIKG